MYIYIFIFIYIYAYIILYLLLFIAVSKSHALRRRQPGRRPATLLPPEALRPARYAAAGAARCAQDLSEENEWIDDFVS